VTVTIPLPRDAFHAEARTLARTDGLTVTGRRYPTGVESLTIGNARGRVEVLPYMGQMVWDAVFDGLRLTMGSQFDMPRLAPTIIGTYGCLAFHSGLLRNGVPAAADTHPVHGEFPTAPMDEAALEIGSADGTAFVRVTGRRDHIEGFGPHYRARPSVTLTAGSAMFDLGMDVENRSATPMELMYMAHVNFAWVPGARIDQSAPFSPDRTRVRAAVPAHVTPNPDYLALIAELADDPARMQVLDEPQRYDPEQVFYITDPGTDAEGIAHLLMRRPEGDGFALDYRPEEFPRLVRWVLVNGDTQVAAFALPSTCEPEGYLAEKAKGNVRLLAPAGRARFGVRLGYLTQSEAAARAAEIVGQMR